MSIKINVETPKTPQNVSEEYDLLRGYRLCRSEFHEI